MGEFTIQIAGFSAAVTSLFASTKDYCIRYLSQDEPQCRITVTREDLEFEQEALRQEALEEGIKIRKFTDPFLERTAIQRKLAEYLFDRDILSGRLGDTSEYLSYLDVLVDGPFVMAKKNLSLRFRGSENQRLIDVPASLKSGEIILWQDWQG